MCTGKEVNDAIFFLPTSPVFPFILIIDVFFIWRERGTRNNPAFVHESVRFGGGGVMVYAVICIDWHTDFHIIRNGTPTDCR